MKKVIDDVKDDLLDLSGSDLNPGRNAVGPDGVRGDDLSIDEPRSEDTPPNSQDKNFINDDIDEYGEPIEPLAKIEKKLKKKNKILNKKRKSEVPVEDILNNTLNKELLDAPENNDLIPDEDAVYLDEDNNVINGPSLSTEDNIKEFLKIENSTEDLLDNFNKKYIQDDYINLVCSGKVNAIFKNKENLNNSVEWEMYEKNNREDRVNRSGTCFGIVSMMTHEQFEVDKNCGLLNNHIPYCSHKQSTNLYSNIIKDVIEKRFHGSIICKVISGHEHGKKDHKCHLQIFVSMEPILQINIKPFKLVIRFSNNNIIKPWSLLFIAQKGRCPNALENYCKKDNDYQSSLFKFIKKYYKKDEKSGNFKFSFVNTVKANIGVFNDKDFYIKELENQFPNETMSNKFKWKEWINDMFVVPQDDFQWTWPDYLNERAKLGEEQRKKWHLDNPHYNNYKFIAMLRDLLDFEITEKLDILEKNDYDNYLDFILYLKEHLNGYPTPIDNYYLEFIDKQIEFFQKNPGNKPKYIDDSNIQNIDNKLALVQEVDYYITTGQRFINSIELDYNKYLEYAEWITNESIYRVKQWFFKYCIPEPDFISRRRGLVLMGFRRAKGKTTMIKSFFNNKSEDSFNNHCYYVVNDFAAKDKEIKNKDIRLLLLDDYDMTGTSSTYYNKDNVLKQASTGQPFPIRNAYLNDFYKWRTPCVLTSNKIENLKYFYRKEETLNQITNNFVFAYIPNYIGPPGTEPKPDIELNSGLSTLGQNLIREVQEQKLREKELMEKANVVRAQVIIDNAEKEKDKKDLFKTIQVNQNDKQFIHKEVQKQVKEMQKQQQAQPNPFIAIQEANNRITSLENTNRILLEQLQKQNELIQQLLNNQNLK